MYRVNIEFKECRGNINPAKHGFYVFELVGLQIRLISFQQGKIQNGANYMLHTEIYLEGDSLKDFTVPDVVIFYAIQGFKNSLVFIRPDEK